MSCTMKICVVIELLKHDFVRHYVIALCIFNANKLALSFWLR